MSVFPEGTSEETVDEDAEHLSFAAGGKDGTREARLLCKTPTAEAVINVDDVGAPTQFCETIVRKKIMPECPPEKNTEIIDATIAEGTLEVTSLVDPPGGNRGEKNRVNMERRRFDPKKLTKKNLRNILPSVDNVCHLIASSGAREETEYDIFSLFARQEIVAEDMLEQYAETTDEPLPAVPFEDKITAHPYLALAFRRGLKAAKCLQNHRLILTACQDLGQICPRLLKSTEAILDCILLTTPAFSEDRSPLFQFGCSQLRMWIKIIRRGLASHKLTCIQLEECVSCLYELEVYVHDQDRYIAQLFGLLVRNVIVGISDLATNINVRSNYAPVDYVSIAESILIMAKHNKYVEKSIDIEILPKLEDLDVQHLIGAGGFGSVYKAFFTPVLKKSSQPVACTLKLVAASAFSKLEHAVTTRIVASVVSHPCIVQYLCVYSLEDATVEIMEYIKGRDLQKVVDATQGLDLPETVMISAQLIAAIIHLHLQGIIHRDIKASNVLVTRRGRVKLIDFDTTKFCLAHFPNRVVTEFFRRTAEEFRDGERAGTLSYMPPEVFTGEPYGRLIDLWAFGITLHKMVVGQTPFRSANDEKLKREVCTVSVNLAPERIHDKHEEHERLRKYAVNIIERLLEKDRRHRLGCLSYSEVLGHPFHAEVRWEDVCKKNSLKPLDKYADAFLQANLAKMTAPAFVDVAGLSPFASTAARQRNDILRVDSYHGKAICESAILVYASTAYKRLAMGNNHDITEDIPALRRVGFRFSSITEMMPARTECTQDILIGSSDIEVSGFESIGVACREVLSQSSQKYFLVTEIEPKSIAEVASSLLVGDLISHVNGEAVRKLTKLTWSRYPMVTLTVHSASTSRILASSADAKKFFYVPPEECRIRARKKCWLKTVTELEARQVSFFSHSTRRTMTLFVLWSGQDKKKTLYHGDILLGVNEISFKGLTEQQVNILLSARTEFTIKYLPISCLRDSHSYFDRFLNFRGKTSSSGEAGAAKPVHAPRLVSFILPITTAAESKSKLQNGPATS